MIKEGTVIKSTGNLYIVLLQDDSRIFCNLKGKFKIKGISATNPVVVGDNVIVEQLTETDTGLITKILPRRNYIVRQSKKLSKMSQVIASNVDIAFIVATLVNPKTSLGFIDRILFTCEAYHIKPVIVFNKYDIYDENLKEDLNQVMSLYSGIGYKCLEISALMDYNLDKLKELMKDKTSLFIGHSGVGKSAIVNAVQPGLNLRTSNISLVHNKGMHTTTFAEMHKLDFGGFIIDTPGVKEFSLIDFDKAEVAGYFPDLFAELKGCKFKNCIHINEPECSVKDAVESGKISISRYSSYISIMSSDETEIKYED